MADDEITREMIDAALAAYWGQRPYNHRGRWTEKEREGMRDAIKGRLYTLQTQADVIELNPLNKSGCSHVGS